MTTALVTGASEGIGREFCRQYAQRGLDLVVVARNVERLEDLKAELGEKYGVDVEVLTADLANQADANRVAARLADQERPVDVLVNNAGFGLKTRFLDTPVEKELASIDVMIRAVVLLAHTAGNAMRERGRGTIINIASVAGFMATGSYSATKSFVIVLSESMSAQLAGTGVTVTAVCPGFTHTEFHQRADIPVDKTSAVGKKLWLDADFLVEQAIKDADAGKPVSVPGKQYKVLTTLLRYAPRRLVTNAAFANRHRPQKSQ